MSKNFIFIINQVIKESQYSTAEIAKEAGLTEGQLRIYMNSRTPPLENYHAIIKAFNKLGETELAEQLILKLVGNNWCFYYLGKNNGNEPDPNKILRELSILQGKITNVFENLESLDNFKKMHALIHIQNTISLLHDLIRLIDHENNFLRLFT